jgi:predicted ATPase
LTPDQRIRVFVSSTLRELAPERAAARAAIESLRFTPVLFELGARPHPPRALYRAYLEQSDIFVGIYCQEYGWVAPGMDVSGLEDEYVLAQSKPKLVYVKKVAGELEPRLQEMLRGIAAESVSYRRFETPEELSELLADDLALLVSESFSPPEREEAPRRRSAPVLPAPTSAFVGRRVEIDEVVDLLRRQDVRLVTLVGPGGIGKTRLAIEVTHRALDAFEDGAYFVPLASVAGAEGVLGAVGEALGLSGDTGQGLSEQLRTELGTQELLVVLDNMEHVLDAGPLVTELLAAASGLTVLATSRSRLDVSGEHLYRVPPMTLPEPGEAEPDVIARSDAVRLFATRAEAAGWRTTEADTPIVADIVRRLDGLPLAIELAAAQARLVPAELIHTRLRRRLDLAGGPRDAEERHRTLRSTVAWSYDLLDEPARRFYEVLSVFSGGFTLDAAEAVAEAGEDVEELLASLVDASMVTTESSLVTGVRFGMLETLRDFAAEQLETRGGRDEAARRHLHYFVDVAEDAYLAPPERLLPTRMRLHEERDNLRVALDEAMRVNGNDAVRLAGALGGYYFRRALGGEGRPALEAALAAAPDAPSEWRARALVYAAWLAAEHDDCDEADRQAGEALDLYRALGDARGVAVALNTLGYAASTRGDFERAVAIYEDAYSSFAETEYDWRLYAAVNLATALIALRRDLDEARLLLLEALDYFTPHGFEDEAASVQFRLAEAEEAAGNLAAARTWVEKGVAASRRIGNRTLLAWELGRLGHIEAADGRLDEAARAYAESWELHVEYRHRAGLALCAECVAALALRRSDYERTARLLGAAHAIRVELSAAVPEVEQLEALETEARARSELGDDLFEQAFAEGSALDRTGLSALVGEALAAFGPAG